MLNFTAEALVNPLPVITTVVPVTPAGGLKLLIEGTAPTVKLEALVACPPEVETMIGPLPVVPTPTVA